jgi:hypothetical protein
MAGKEVILCPTVEVVHDARRQSHTSLRYFTWHVVSMLRFFMSAPFARLVLFRAPAKRRLRGERR